MLLVFLAALAIRATFVVVQTRFAIFDTPFLASDSRAYLNFAEGILAGRGLSIDGVPSALAGPVYPLFLAVLMRLGLGPEAIGLVQAVLGAATAVLIGVLAREYSSIAGFDPVLSRRLGLAAASAGAGYPHLILWTGYILTETLFVFLVASSLVSVFVAERTRSRKHAFMAGLLGALAALTRSALLTCGVLMFLLWLYVALRRRKGVALPLLFAVALTVPHVGWALRNFVELGAPVVTVTQSGAILYQGNAAGIGGGSTGYLDASEIPPLSIPPGLTEIERDRVYMERALHDMRADPVAAVARWPAKLWNMWRPTYEGASLRNAVAFTATYVPVLAFGLFGLFMLAVRRPTISIRQIPVIVFAAWVAMHVVLVGLIRYRVPGELILLSTAPIGAMAIWDRITRTRHG